MTLDLVVHTAVARALATAVVAVAIASAPAVLLREYHVAVLVEATQALVLWDAVDRINIKY